LQPDIYAGGGNLARLDLADFARRVEAHRKPWMCSPTPCRSDPLSRSCRTIGTARHSSDEACAALTR
jgi:hypothetical protein